MVPDSSLADSNAGGFCAKSSWASLVSFQLVLEGDAVVEL